MNYKADSESVREYIKSVCQSYGVPYDYESIKPLIKDPDNPRRIICSLTRIDKILSDRFGTADKKYIKDMADLFDLKLSSSQMQDALFLKDKKKINLFLRGLFNEKSPRPTASFNEVVESLNKLNIGRLFNDTGAFGEYDEELDDDVDVEHRFKDALHELEEIIKERKAKNASDPKYKSSIIDGVTDILKLKLFDNIVLSNDKTGSSKDNVLWMTTPTIIWNYADYKFNWGKFALRFSLGSGSLRILPFSDNCVTSGGCFFPVAEEDGSVCWGNFSHKFYDMQKRGKISDMAVAALELLQTWSEDMSPIYYPDEFSVADKPIDPREYLYVHPMLAKKGK